MSPHWFHLFETPHRRNHPTLSTGVTMAVPVISSASFDAATYVTGATATLTVVRNDTSGSSTTDAVTVTATDNVTGEVATESVSLTVNDTVTDPTTVAVSSAEGRTFTLVSDDGVTAVYTTTV